MAPTNVAHRVNLGLVPTSSASWLAACKALRSDGSGWLHIHENIDSGPNSVGICTCQSSNSVDSCTCIVRRKYKGTINPNKAILWCAFIARTLDTLAEHFRSFSKSGLWTVQLKHVEHVKSYAPHVDHVVLDVLCKPPATTGENG